jgi:hypothetical protein
MTSPDLPELVELQRIIEDGAPDLEVRQLCEVEADGHCFPVHAMCLGNPDPALPAAGFFGGIHGLERIGTQVLLVFLRGLLARLQWDMVLHRQLESVRLVFVPLVNPGGMWLATRANPRGVDLMRNAPVEAKERVPFLFGGQRLTSLLPWYRGLAGAPLEPEAQAVCDIVEDELLTRPFSIALDCHSGFGVRDRIWFPFAHTVMPPQHLPEIHALMGLYDQTYPHHNYVFEPQSRQYLTHGDLWDHLYLQATADNRERVFLPLTLEMGSWLWVKKNPRQMFSRRGFFNPLPLHRLQRVLRGHLLWLDFLARAACGYQRWSPQAGERMHHHEQAVARWYWGTGN